MLRKTFRKYLPFIAASLLANTAVAGNDCGSKSSGLNNAARLTAVPQGFPITSVLDPFYMPAFIGCAPFGVANFRPACRSHDACYESAGASRTTCDGSAKKAWRKACTDTYKVSGWRWLEPVSASAESACREACLTLTDLMVKAIKSDLADGAFSEAQKASPGFTTMNNAYRAAIVSAMLPLYY